MLNHRDFFVVELDPLPCVTMLYQAVVVTAPCRVAMVYNHGVQLIRMPPLYWRILKARQQRVHSLRAVIVYILLVAIYLLICKLTVKVILIKRKREWELDIIGKFAFILVKSLHLYYQNARY